MPVQKIRFGDYVREVSVSQLEISYGDLTPKVRYDKKGRELSCVPPKIRLQAMDIYRLLRPYVGVRFMDQVRAVLPLAVYLFLFQLVIMLQVVTDS